MFGRSVQEVGSSALPAEFSSVLAHRSDPLIRTMSQAGAALLLLGEAGSGKSYLARHVASTVASAADGRVHPVILPSPPGVSYEPTELFGPVAPEITRAQLPEAGGPHPFDAEDFAERLLAELRSRAAGSDLLLVLPGVDRYSPDSVAVLEHLMRERAIRLLATATRQVGGASCLARDPRVTRSAIPPLDPQEADALLSSLLGVSHIAPETLNRWHIATAGNSYALIMLLLANERAGTLRRRNGLAWVPPGLDEIPEEFISFLDESCSDAERETLEMVALAEPMIEVPLLRLLDPEATNALLERNLIVSRHHPSGQRALMITRPILAMAIRDRISPLRRIQLSDAFFAALTSESMEPDIAQGRQLLVSRVVFGLESGRPVPHSWLARAFTSLSIDGDPRLVLRVSLALARGHASPDAAAAAVRAA